MNSIHMRILSAMMSIILIFSLLTVCLFADEKDDNEVPPFSVDSSLAIIMNAETETVLYAKNPDEHFFCGFVPRFVICILLMRSQVDLEKSVTITEEMMKVSHDQSSANLKKGETLTLRDLLKCVLVGNSQEAAIAIALTLYDSVNSCISIMNNYMGEIGVSNTYFTSVTGQYSSSKDSYTTVRDIAKIASIAITFDFIEEYSSKRYVEIDVSGKSRQIFNKNTMMDTYSDKYYKKASGLQISGSATNGYSMVTRAKSSTMNLISVAVNSDSLSGMYEDIKNMIVFSLQEYASRSLVTKNIPITEIDIHLGKNRDKLTLVASEGISVFIPRSIENEDIEVIINAPESVTAPVTKGDVLGSVTYKYDGSVLGRTDIIAQNSVALDYVAMYTEKIDGIFGNVYIWLILGLVLFAVIVYCLFIYIVNRKKIKSQMRKDRSRVRLGR